MEEIIQKFQKFLEQHYYAELLEKVRKGQKYIVIDFGLLSEFDVGLAELLLEQPEDTIKSAEIAVEQFDLPGDVKGFRVRFQNLPESQKIMVRNIRSKHLSSLLWMEGIVRQKSDVRPQVTASKFECPSCGHFINVLQLDNKLKEPTRCGCGRKGRFRLVSKELVDAQSLTLEEAPEDLEGGEQPKRIKVFLKNDLVSPISEKQTNPGTKITVVGEVKELPIILRSGGQSTRFDIFIDANYVEAVQEEFITLDVAEEEMREIKELSQDPKLFTKMINSVAPSIYGHEAIKEALIFQIMGGLRKRRDDGVITRGDVHILLIGDPGSGKCVSGDSRIMLDNGGIMTIKEFTEGSHPDGCVVSINENGRNSVYKPTRLWRRKAPKKMLRITTNTGNALVCTKDHPLFTTNHGLIFARSASEYEVGEYIALPSRIDVDGSIQSVPTDIIHTKANNRVKYQVKEFLDHDFARLMGYLVGDGYVRFRKTTGIISFTNSNKELLDDFEFRINRVFNLGVSKRKKENSTAYEYYLSSIDLVRILENISPKIVRKSADLNISQIILRSPNYVLKEFLKSLFDCEAHVSKDKREIEISSKSKELIYDIKYVLLRFGIISQVSSSLKYASNTKNKRLGTYYRLRISGEDIIRYHNEIGFVSTEKIRRLEGWIEKSRLNTNLKVVPNLRILLKVLRRNHRLTQFEFPIKRTSYQHYERGDRHPSYDMLKQICEKYSGLNSKDPLTEVLHQISNADIFWDRISTIELIDYDDDFVYDLEIERVHNFVANGVMVHNSQLLKRILTVAPKARYVSGKGTSGAGLTASVVKDEFLHGYSLEAGALVLANRGMCCIDELDKMSKEDRSAMHEALEQQTVSISKANIQATLMAETTVLAAANPKFGRFDPYGNIAEQIDLPSTLINRFDLIFPIKDVADEEKDDKMAKFILSLHQNPDTEEPEIPTKLLRKYIAYAKQNLRPKLTDSAMDEMRSYYLKMRASGATEGAIKSIPISPRQLEGLIRLSEAAARIRLSDKVTKRDARRAIRLLDYCLRQIALDEETGTIDIDRIATGIPATQRTKIVGVKEIIMELENKLGKTIPIEDIIRMATERGIDEGDVDSAIEKLKRSGDVFEPRRGFLSRI